MMSAMKHTEETEVFVPLKHDGGLPCLVDLGAGRQWAFAFTTAEKAKAFVVVAGVEADRLLPITLGEWFGRQEVKGWPDLAIDPDPETLRDYPLRIDADLSKHDIQCVTRETLAGWQHEVTVRRRTKREE